MKEAFFVFWNFLLAMGAGILIFFGSFFGLKYYTHHGEEIVVPDITGMSVDEAAQVLAAQDLVLDVVDSTYTSKVPLGAVLEQNPLSGSHVKAGRHIYVTQNAREEQRVQLPDLRDISIRQAEGMLQRNKLKIENIVYEPSEYNGLVLDVRYGGQSVSAGASLKAGSAVVLVVGRSGSDEDIVVPNLCGLNINEARERLLECQLVLGAVVGEGEFVYSQSPAAGNTIGAGHHVDIYVTPDSVSTPIIEKEEDDFF